MIIRDKEKDRYSRQTLYHRVGCDGQEMLLSSKVIVIGVGALGGNIANLLARSGVGNILLVDRDKVELNNLQRQLIFDEADVGKPKAEVVARELKMANTSIKIEGRVLEVDASNIHDIIKGVDIVLDGTDNVKTRFLINDACVQLGIPWVYGGVVKAEGMTMTIIPKTTPCLRCILPKIPEPGSTQTCNEVGILNGIAAVVASLQATEALKLLMGKEPSKGLALINIWDRKMEVVDIDRNTSCQACGDNVSGQTGSDCGGK